MAGGKRPKFSPNLSRLCKRAAQLSTFLGSGVPWNRSSNTNRQCGIQTVNQLKRVSFPCLFLRKQSGFLPKGWQRVSVQISIPPPSVLPPPPHTHTIQKPPHCLLTFRSARFLFINFKVFARRGNVAVTRKPEQDHNPAEIDHEIEIHPHTTSLAFRWMQRR